MEPCELPRITPYLLRRAETLCPLRLQRDLVFRGGLRSPFLRFRVRDPLVAAARAAHARLAPARLECFRVPDGLRAEERALFERAAHCYVAAFADRPVRTLDHGVEGPTVWEAEAVRLGGTLDLAVEDASGRPELRQLELWQRALPGDPLDSAEIRLAVLRLSRFTGKAKLRVSWADLVGGDVRIQDVDLDEWVPRLEAWLRDRLAVIRSRMAAARPRPGVECGTCLHLPSCPRIRYECLALDEDPEPFEPDAESLELIRAELSEVVKAIRAERLFAGVSDPVVCRWCRYRSVCPDSAAPETA